MEETKELITTDDIRSKVYIIRGQQVMLDKDLAEIYGYEVKKLNQQVKRNIERFPEDFMFRLSNSEIDSVRSQIVTSKMCILPLSVESESFPGNAQCFC